MTSPAPLLIEAIVHKTERPALVAASKQLADCLAAAADGTWPIELRFRESVPPTGLRDGRAVVVTSLLLEIPGRDEPLPQTEARWRDQLLSLMETSDLSAVICTVFRHVADRESSPITERIRRLNLIAAELSHDTGAGVVDIDRVFSYFGARQLQTDYRLGGALAAEVAGRTVASGILAAGLDDLIPPDIQERARKLLGTMREISSLIKHRLTVGAPADR
jgi:hypothetical protein